MLEESFEKKGIFREAEEWRHKKLVKDLLAAEARMKEQEKQEMNENKKTQ